MSHQLSFLLEEDLVCIPIISTGPKTALMSCIPKVKLLARGCLTQPVVESVLEVEDLTLSIRLNLADTSY